jgi:dihydropteroate synthase
MVASPDAGIWSHRRGVFDLRAQGLIMGVLNVTPDSFSDGGDFMDPNRASRRAAELESAGAGIIDIGGESSRPGSEPVPEEEELRRVIPVIRAIRSQSDIPISIDTTKAAVAREAILSGADIVNDISGLRADPAMPELVASTSVGVVIMHMRGTPRTMQQSPHYGDALKEVCEFLRQAMERALTCGMDAQKIAVDPGIGFGKTPDHNRDLIAGIPLLASLGRPVLIGVSRKSFLAWAGAAPEMEDRFWPGVALTSFCRELGARIFRVHEPQPHSEALRMTEAILAAHGNV